MTLAKNGEKPVIDADETKKTEPQDGAAEVERRSTAAEPEEIGGPAGPDPTRYGDWERKGRCIDF